MCDLFKLPGPARFAAELASLITEGRSVLVRVPKGQPVPVLPTLTSLLEAQGYPCHELPPDATPSAALAWALGIDSGCTPSLLKHPRLRGGGVFLGEVSAWPAWQIFLKELEGATQCWDAMERPRILLHGSAQQAGCPPPQTPLLAVRTWRGCVGALDLKVHVGSALLDRPISGIQRRLLTEQIVSLSLWDPDLADRLLDLTPKELSNPAPALIAHATQRGWTEETPVAWEEGTEEDVDGVPQVHLAHAAISGRAEIIRRRQWEGQASIVLPLIDRLRCDLIEDGFNWFKRNLGNITSPASLYDRGIGDLCHLLRTRNGPKDLMQRADGLRWYRNQLSHLRPLPFESLYHYRGWPA